MQITYKSKVLYSEIAKQLIKWLEFLSYFYESKALHKKISTQKFPNIRTIH